ncbi:MAG: Na-K-Cl cotransporter, partial [Gemmatimonadota bacterium]
GPGPGGPSAGPEEPAADVDLRRPEEADTEGLPGARRIARFGTFGGVFTPTLLTILGVIMFLREGWVIGNAGILGGAAIILFSFGITACTALSMSSITTNIRIGAGGAYAIVAQSLGLEIGGALGIPRYLSQALAVTLYVFGFREGWLWIFPEHPALLVDLAIFLSLFGIAWLSADLAIRVQYVIMAVIGAALASVAMAALTGSMEHPVSNVGWWGSFPGSPEDGFRGTDFWTVFAVFFPASTGIMAGANMSGELKDPKRSIPRGTLAAIAVSLMIYLALAYWLARSATPGELVSNYTVMIDEAYWGPPVLAGLLGATFSSALASLVGSARILMAMGEHRVLPGGEWLERRTEAGEPRNAMLVTGVVLFLSMLMRDLNAVAPLITMFFLVTYAMLNGVLLLEQSLGLVSFRPRMEVPRWVPLAGLVGSLFAMFIINPTLGWVSIVVVLVFYGVLLRRRLEAPFADVRSGLFVALAEWAAEKVGQLPSRQERAWRPNLLVPVSDPRELRGTFQVIEAVTRPQGSVSLVGLAADADAEATLMRRLGGTAASFRERGVPARTTVIRSPGLVEAGGWAESVTAGMQALRGSFFRPNVVFLRLPSDPDRREAVRRIVREADHERIGVMLYAPHALSGLGQRASVNVWIRDRAPDWRISWDIGNLDLSILAALLVSRNWRAELRLHMAVEEERHLPDAREFLDDLVELARLHRARTHVHAASFRASVERAPQADLGVFGLVADPDFGFVEEMRDRSGSSVLFVRDSGQESVLA